jgi:hypothetical protein
VGCGLWAVGYWLPASGFRLPAPSRQPTADSPRSQLSHHGDFTHLNPAWFSPVSGEHFIRAAGL